VGSTDADDLDPAVLARLRPICLGLPEAHEELAWTGVRWRVRKRTFAHVLAVEQGEPEFLARLVGADVTATILTFRSSGTELDVLRHAGHPFFHAGWGRDAMGMVLGAATDWTEVAELLTESYCLLAPKKLQVQVDRPDPAP
jgi:predicted DNA-binding protein (MmcQ/YjbR family)